MTAIFRQCCRRSFVFEPVALHLHAGNTHRTRAWAGTGAMNLFDPLPAGPLSASWRSITSAEQLSMIMHLCSPSRWTKSLSSLCVTLHIGPRARQKYFIMTGWKDHPVRSPKTGVCQLVHYHQRAFDMTGVGGESYTGS